MLIAGATLYYLGDPPTTTKTTTELDAKGHVVKTTTEEQSPIGDSILLGGFGLAALLGLTALLNGRLKLTGPGGSGVEVAAAAVAAAADSALDPLIREHEARRGATELAPEVSEAVARWKGLRAKILGQDDPPKP